MSWFRLTAPKEYRRRLGSYAYREVFVIPPHMLKSTRGRYGQTGACTVQSDAHLLADLLRTDRARLHPWKPDP